MIKTIHEITLKDILLLDETKRATHLLIYKWMPFFIVRGRLEKLAQEIFQQLGNNTIEAIQDEFEKLILYRKILLLEALHGAIVGELKLKTKINTWRVSVKKDIIESKDLTKIIDDINSITGIRIETDEDLVKFEKHIEFKVDKFRELYPKKKQEEKTDLGKIIYSVFNYMGESYNIDMRLMDFVKIKEVAEDKAIKLKSKEHGK